MELLKEREKTHGSYTLTAQTAQTLKRLFRNAPSYADMTTAQRESMDMIAVKLARIMCGNPHDPDHWLDISGYATLIVGELNARRG